MGAVASLTLLAGLSFGGDEPGGSGRSGGEIIPAKRVKELVDHLEVAKSAEKSRKQGQAIVGARRDKHDFITVLYLDGEDRLFGCNAEDSLYLLRALERVDLDLEIGALERGKAGEKRVQHAASEGMGVASTVAGCPGADEGARVIADEIASRTLSIREQSKDNKLTPKALKEGIKRLDAIKRRLLASQRIQDCEAARIYSLLKDIDVPLDRAGNREEFEHDFNSRRKLVEEALPHARKLLELWRECGIPECSDRANNDGDDLIDRNDPGCLTGPGGAYERRDRSEQDTSLSHDCTRLEVGKPITSVFGVTSAGARVVGHNLRNATDNAVVFERADGAADFAAGGPVSLGSAICGPGTSATLESWSVQGLQVGMTLRVAKDDAGVMPAATRIVLAADTR